MNKTIEEETKWSAIFKVLVVQVSPYRKRMRNLFKELMTLHAAEDGGEKTFRKIIIVGFAVSIFFSLIILGAAVLDLKNLVNFQPDFAKFGAIVDFLGGCQRRSKNLPDGGLKVGHCSGEPFAVAGGVKVVQFVVS